jgi:superfamily I DNA and/or RNA helicase
MMRTSIQDPALKQWYQAIEAEEQAQKETYRMDGSNSLRALKAAGIALHPFKVQKKQFGYADYPELDFFLPYPGDTQQFKEGAAIEVFYEQEPPVQGILLEMGSRQGRLRLLAPDYPDWIEQGAGLKLAPDTHTTEWMKKGLVALEKNKSWYPWFRYWSNQETQAPLVYTTGSSTPAFEFKALNESQGRAAHVVLETQALTIVHGPPGTGKSTTLVEAMVALVARGEKLIVTAPSNAAVDHLAQLLVHKGVSILRVGNTGKVHANVYPHTIEAKLSAPALVKEIKTLRKQAESFRSMALKYKRSYGKSEREQRQLLFQEVKKIRQQIRSIQSYEEEKMVREAQVVMGTPVGLMDAGLQKIQFGALIIDEAGQCLAPLAWMLLPLTEKLVVAGDPWQLPPTVLSQAAMRLGFHVSILEWLMQREPSHLLELQYRMRTSIAGFSSHYFYAGALQTPAHLSDEEIHIHFIDTAGAGMEEQAGKDGNSLENPGELKVIEHLASQLLKTSGSIAFISPYSAQVEAARQQLPAQWRISTIDSFQGQESDQVVISLVRSNEDGVIGFLKDYRRMNVALTRARQQLWIIGDSATLSRDPFYDQLIEYVQSVGQYLTVWELGMEW